MPRIASLAALVFAAVTLGAGAGTAAEAAEAADIAGTTLNGQRLSLKWYRGKWVFVNVWASWCGPCNAEAAAYAAFVKKNPSVRFVGLNVDDTRSGARAFVKRYRWTWPSLVDPDRKLEGRLGVVYQPVVVVIDPKGEIAGIHAGPGNARIWSTLLGEARS